MYEVIKYLFISFSIHNTIRLALVQIVLALLKSATVCPRPDIEILNKLKKMSTEKMIRGLKGRTDGQN